MRVVVTVDEVRDDHVGERRETVGDTRRNEDANMVLSAEIETQRVAIGGSALAKVVQHDACRAERDIPIVGLVQVIVQSNHGALLAVGAIALQHLATVGEPLTAIGLDEQAALVTMNGGLHDPCSCDQFAFVHIWHQ